MATLTTGHRALRGTPWYQSLHRAAENGSIIALCQYEPLISTYKAFHCPSANELVHFSSSVYCHVVGQYLYVQYQILDMLRGLWRGRNCFVLSNPSPRDGNMVTNILSPGAICGQITPHLASWAISWRNIPYSCFVLWCAAALELQSHSASRLSGHNITPTHLWKY